MIKGDSKHMRFYKLEPEIAGEIGDNSIIQYENGKISKIKYLEFRFTDWLGDELISTHPCYIITENLKEEILLNKLRGIQFQNILISFSDEFFELNDSTVIPNFVQIICENKYEEKNDVIIQDFYVNEYKELIVSENALNVFQNHTLNNCVIQEL